jgi:hypothetical protein
MSSFERATRKRVKIMSAFVGPSGSGKTISSLLLASAVIRKYGGELCVIETQRGQIFDYAETRFAPPNGFDVCSLEGNVTCEIIHAKVAEAKKIGKYSVILIDTLSKAWDGEGGTLAQSESMGKDMIKWQQLNKPINRLVDYLAGCGMHVIITLRTKTDWVFTKEIKNDKEVSVPHRIGTAPIQKKGIEYEFGNFFRMDENHQMTVERSPLTAWDKMVIDTPTIDTFEPLIEWASNGSYEGKFERVVGKNANGAQLSEFYSKVRRLHDWDEDRCRVNFVDTFGMTPEQVSEEFLEEKLKNLREEYAKRFPFKPLPVSPLQD